MRRGLIFVATAVLLASAVLGARSANAQSTGGGQGSAFGDPGSIGAGVTSPGASTSADRGAVSTGGTGGGTGGGGSAAHDPCRYKHIDAVYYPSLIAGHILPGPAPAGDDYWSKNCPVSPTDPLAPFDSPDWSGTLSSCVGQPCYGTPGSLSFFAWPIGAPPPGTPAAPAVTGADVAQQAKQRTPLDPPAIHMNPAANQDQLVQLATWLWSDPSTWQTQHATATIDTISATTTAVPVNLIFDMGDGQPGSTFTCPGPGTSYDSAHPSATPACTYKYAKSSAGHAPNNSYQVKAWIDWHVTWTATDGTSGDFGIIRGLPSTQLVRVAEQQAINTPG